MLLIIIGILIFLFLLYPWVFELIAHSLPFIAIVLLYAVIILNCNHNTFFN